MEKHNVIEGSRTPGLEKEAAGGDMFDEAKSLFAVGVVSSPAPAGCDFTQGAAPHVSKEK